MFQDPYKIRELRVGDRREAELLADMWNRSDEGWPGGWTGGVPITAERILTQDMQWDCYGQWVAEYADEIVGYITLLADPSQPQRAYVGMLNARPDHHGKGVGRRLLRRAIRQAVEAGFEQMDLHTWPGNLKAVPLYKKTGFFWSPETSAHMQNFIPAIIRMPLVADFFRQHDWYQVQERDLSVAEDVERWHGVRIYRYRFAAEGRRVEVLVDRLAQMPTAIETNEVYVAAWVGAEDLCALQEHTLCYEFRNNGDRPVRLSVLAQGEAGVPVSVEETFELRRRHRLAIPFRLPADLERKRPGEPPHRILSTVTVDGVPVKLGTAVQKRDPVEVQYGAWGFPVGKWTDVRIKLRNRLPFPVNGTLWVGSPAEVERSQEKLSFRISRGGWTSASLRVRASRPGAYPLEARVNFSEETSRKLADGKTPPLRARGRPRTLWTRAFAPGTFITSEDAEERTVTVESDRLRVQFRRVGGRMDLTDKGLGRGLLGVQMSEVGPPFGHFSPLPRIYDVEVRNLGGSVHLVTRRREDRWPGVTLERTVVVTPGMVELRHCLLNAADRSLKLQVRASVYGYLEAGKITIPSGDGLLQHERVGWGDWPGWRELRKQSKEFPESWVAAEDEGAVVGTVWEGDAEIAPRGGGGAEITYQALAVPAGGTAELPPIRLVAGAGNHKLVRSVWSTYVHQKPLLTPEEREPSVRKLIRGGLSRVPAILTRPRHRLAVELSSEQRRQLDGEVRLTLPKGVALAGGTRELRFPVRGLAEGSPRRRAVTVRPAATRPTAGVGELRLSAQREDYVFPVPVVIARSGRSRLRLRKKDDTIAVDTGWLQFQVSAEHGGSIVSLRSRGRELVRSSYPTPSPYQWMNPWYGGIRAQAGSEWDRRLQAVRRRIEPVKVVGSDGCRWQGAQVTAVPTHADWRWLRYEVQYLSMAGSNLLAVLIKATNRTTTSMGVNVNVALWPQQDSPQAHVEREGRPSPCRPDRYQYEVRAKGWAALTCSTGHVLTVVAKDLPGWHMGVENFGDGTFNASVSRRADLNPKVRSLTTLVWLVACESIEEAYAYRYLKELNALP